MDENKPRRWLSFGIRDLLWAMVVVGMGIGWWMDRSRLSDGLEALIQHIYTTEGRYAHWNDFGEMIVTDR
jgi:hypothetical protein